MKFYVKLLALLLVLVMFGTQIVSCAFPWNRNDETSDNTNTNNGVVVIPPNNNGGNNNNGNNENNGNNGGNTVGSVVVGNATAPYIADVHVSASVEPDEENKVPAGGVNLDSSLASATVPGGVQLEAGATELALTINGIKDSEADINLSETDVSSSFDVHVSGVATSNLVPMEVKLAAAALKGLNSTSIKLYHVEDGVTIEMTYVPNDEEFTAHNQFKYDPVTGDVTLYIASFSEFAIVNDTVNAWDGSRDYSWYDADATQLYIANAQQLAGFSAIVGEMDGQTQDSFEGKTVTLIADINLGDDEANNDSDIIFYPIGYWNNEGTYEKTGTDIDSGFYSFMGTFDGNGHTVSNFYQNTWEMKGDHNWYDATLQYYRDGMGLFGKIYGGTVKNLTVSNFSSDGEITTTGVIAAYADGATFENISIFNCNPRVYNIGNGGIVGCVGWYAIEEGLKTTFTNITVDNTNKISALWGSYDVACGGILGQYYPTSGQSSYNYPVNAGIEFTNCHVSAIMDVYNDVCANYQYYAYRYTGMLIGSVRENETIDGRVYPKMDGIKASGCTVHFGTWNDYYYCEIIDNTTASYTHDYQMSRLTQVASVDVENMEITTLDGETVAIPTSGRANYVVVNGEHATENATCYHFKDGEVWNHEDGGYHDGTDGGNIIDENGDGTPDLREDKQHLYLEFNNLFTGYGWGVTSVGLETYENVNVKDKLADIEIGGGDVEGSVEKFESTGTTEVEIGSTYTLGDLFAAIENSGVAIKNDNVVVTVSPADTTQSMSATYYMSETGDWKDGTITFHNLGDANITISDYYFCKTLTIQVEVIRTDKFEYLYGENRNGVENPNHKDFLLRVGNQNTVSLNLLFGAIDNCYPIDLDTLTVTATNCTFTKGNTWDASTISFADYTGIATITIQDETSNSCSIKVEVVDGLNTTSAMSTTYKLADDTYASSNIVLLGDIGSGFTVSGRYTFYGNGFELNYTGNGQYLNNGLKQGLITVSENGTIDNLRIKMPIYPKAYMYYGSTVLGDYVQGASDDEKSVETTDTTTKTRYHYQLSAIVAKDNATIANCYIYGGRNNIFVDTGNITIKDTILERGTVANVQIQSSSDYIITLENVTTIQTQQNATIGDTTQVMLGAGILVGPETNNNPTIVLNGTFKQYNWVNSENANAVSSETSKMIINGALEATDYNHTIDGKTSSNLGIIYMNTYDVSVENNTGLPYVEKTVTMKVGANSADGKAYSLQGATEEQIYSDSANADRKTINGYYTPQFSYSSDLGGYYEAKSDDKDTFFYREGDTIKVMFPSGDSKEVNLGALVDITKYTNSPFTVTIMVKDSKENDVEITEDGVITLSAADEYTITYTVTDTQFYDKDGNTVTKSVNYSWNVTLSVSLKDTAVPDAEFNFVAENQKMGYYTQNLVVTKNVYQYIPFLAGLQIYDYNGQTKYLRFDGDNDFNKVASIEVTNKYSGNDTLIVVKLTDGGTITLQLLARADSGGGSTYTGSIKTSGSTIYFVNDGTTSESEATTTAAYWSIDYYKFTGNNGVEITSPQQTFNSTGSSASTPSGNFSTTINHTVSYDANGGKCGQAVSYATSVSTAVTLPTPSRSGYIFIGWYTAASGGTKVGGAGDSYTPSANITLYAQWISPFNVTYNANGGSCDTTSAYYDGTALTLPTATRDGYWFIGWYDAATGGNKIGDAGATFNPLAEITLYAHWQEQIKYTVTYNANGGTCGTANATYEGTALTLPTPDNRTGYTFNGWYTASSGGTKVGDAGATYSPSANTTLYAQWTINSYTVKTSASNATISGVTNGQSIAYGTTVSVTVSFSQSRSLTFTVVNDTTGATILSKSAAGTYTFTMPDSTVTISASSSSCVTGDTLVTLADGTQKRIDQVTFADKLLVWDFDKGEYTVANATIIENHGYDYNNIIKLVFEDGTTIKVVNVHGFFDADLNKWVDIDANNAQNFIGHNFTQVNGDSYKTVKLVSATVTTEYVEAWSILSADQYNCILEGMFSVTPPATLQLAFFEIGEGMKYDAESKAKDIETYGLYTYEEFAHLLTEAEFEALNVAEIKIAVGKGLITYDEVLWLIATYIH